MAGTKGPIPTQLVTVNGNELLFDVRPIELHGFRFKARTVEPIGRPTIKEFQGALQFAGATDESAPYWVGELVAYAETRAEWREKMSQAMAVTGLSRQRLHNLASLVRRVEAPERAIAPSPAHAEVVAKFGRPQQTEWLGKARTEGWTVNELKMNVRAAARRAVIDGQATLEGMFRIVVADCPWPYEDHGSRPAALAKYHTMSVDDICALPVRAHVMPNATLFLWVPVPLLYMVPGPREVLDAWGFTYKSNRVWNKGQGLPSHYAQQITHEHLIIAVRGDGKPDVPTPHEDSIFVERLGFAEHSEKPNAATWAWIKKHWTTGPYLELFGRERREGVTVFGDDARLWPEQMASGKEV